MNEEVRDLADALRTLIEQMVATEAPADVYAGVADDIRAVAARFEGHPKVPLYSGFSEAANADNPSGPFDNSPFMGAANPLAPPVRLWIGDGGHVYGNVLFGSAYEGPPGCVHGGYIAAVFDELLGLAQIVGGNPGMTGRLMVHYRSPTPLRTELQLSGAITRVDGRKTICHGTIHAGDRLCAEAEGLFVAMAGERFQQLLDDRQARLSPGD